MPPLISFIISRLAIGFALGAVTGLAIWWVGFSLSSRRRFRPLDRSALVRLRVWKLDGCWLSRHGAFSRTIEAAKCSFVDMCHMSMAWSWAQSMCSAHSPIKAVPWPPGRRGRTKIRHIYTVARAILVIVLTSWDAKVPRRVREDCCGRLVPSETS